MLTFRQSLFVDYYLGEAGRSATRAARLAGYSCPQVACARLLANVSVKAAIADALEVSAMPRRECLARIALRARSDAGPFLKFDPDGSPDKLPTLDLRKARRRGQLGNVKRMKASRIGGPDSPAEVVDVEIHDALPALALLAKYHGLTEKKADAVTKTVVEVHYVDRDDTAGRPEAP